MSPEMFEQAKKHFGPIEKKFDSLGPEWKDVPLIYKVGDRIQLPVRGGEKNDYTIVRAEQGHYLAEHRHEDGTYDHFYGDEQELKSEMSK